MDVNAYLQASLAYLSSEAWIIQVFLVVLSTVFLVWLQKRVLTQLLATREHQSNKWDSAVIGSLRGPLSALIWVVGITYAADIMRAESGAAILRGAQPVRDIGVIIAITWFLIRFVQAAEHNIIAGRAAAGAPLDRTTADIVAKLVRLSVFITSLLVILQTLGYSISGVLAFGGIGGIAVGFAAKDLLANFFGGLMIYLDRPFTIGDWIRSPEKEIEGVVEHIGWRLTRIRTFDRRPLYVPNGIFTSIVVENASRMTNRRIKVNIGVRYEDASRLSAIVSDVKTMLGGHPDIDQTIAPGAGFENFTPASIEFGISAYTRTTDATRFQEVKQDVMLKVIGIISKHGAQPAAPPPAFTKSP